jgi:hypothetical protein
MFICGDFKLHNMHLILKGCGEDFMNKVLNYAHCKRCVKALCLNV